MAGERKTFSESWYRIADQSISLRPGVRTHRQFYRGEKWFVLQDPFNNQFFRLRPAAYEFVVRLNAHQTVDEVWQECVERFPDSAPGQEDVIALLAQLYQANLLQYDCPADSLVLFRRFRKRRNQEIRSRVAGFMFPRFTLIDPDPFLVRTLPVVRPLFGRFGALLWLVVMAFGIKALVDHAGALALPGSGILNPANLFWLYLAILITKTFHEFGHAYACRYFGGEVHRMGLMLLIFTPVPFMDASSSWAFRSRRQRILVASAGMIVELFIAALAAIVWAVTGEGLVHQLCFNMMFIASVSTLLFNINPLLRFDGYYILSDLLAIPNLHQRSRRQWKFFFERRLFGVRRAQPAARTRSEAGWLYLFGLASGIYRIFLFTAITLFVADQLLVVGMVLALLLAVTWAVVPVGKLVRYLAAAPALSRNRTRAILVSVTLIAVVWIPLRWIPLPHHFRSPGVVAAESYSRVYVQSPGFFQQALVRSGEPLSEGAPIVKLANPDLAPEIVAAEARLRELDILYRRAVRAGRGQATTVEALRVAVRRRIDLLHDQRAQLTLRAGQAGVLHGSLLEDLSGRWLPRGQELGLVLTPDQFEFVAVVAQSRAGQLFDGELVGEAEIRLTGQAGRTLRVTELLVTPYDRSELPSAGLGSLAGGTVQSALDDPRGIRTLEPHFQVTAKVVPDEASRLHHGLTGEIRFRLPNEDLVSRGIRSFRQLLQKRYQI